MVFVEVRSDVNEHFLSRKSDFSDISYAFTEGLIAGAGKAEVGGGWRLEKVGKRQLQQVVVSQETDPQGDRFQRPSTQDTGTWGDLDLRRAIG